MKFRNRMSSLLLIVTAGVLWTACAATQPKNSQIPPVATTSPATETSPVPKTQSLDVPYVPTPQVIVDRMLEMANVTKNDVIYDLGSGDGRIVITAARKYGVRGVGYDLDPERIKESNENAKKAGVTDRVSFVQGDLFQADLSEATVVTLYLLPNINLRLRPKLLKELKAGTRVVSHNYGMGEWKARQTVEMDVNGSQHYIYFWIVPEKVDPKLLTVEE